MSVVISVLVALISVSLVSYVRFHMNDETMHVLMTRIPSQ